MKTMSLVWLFVPAFLVGCATKPAGSGSDYGAASASCKPTTEAEIRALFTRWNDSLQTRVPKNVVANYAPRSILLPTLSNTPRITPAEKEAYFVGFLADWPTGKIDYSFVDIGCNYAVDAGLYTFTFQRTNKVVAARYSYSYRWTGREWLITSHHSSKMPETVPTE